MEIIVVLLSSLVFKVIITVLRGIKNSLMPRRNRRFPDYFSKLPRTVRADFLKTLDNVTQTHFFEPDVPACLLETGSPLISI